jgi:hypothetical protein
VCTFCVGAKQALIELSNHEKLFSINRKRTKKYILWPIRIAPHGRDMKNFSLSTENELKKYILWPIRIAPYGREMLDSYNSFGGGGPERSGWLCLSFCTQ